MYQKIYHLHNMIDLGRKPLTLESIEELVSQESIWHWLLPNFQRVGKKFKYRAEGQPSAIINYEKGNLKFKDFGNTNPSESWVGYLMNYQGHSFMSALELIRDTFNLPLGSNTIGKKKSFKSPKIYPKQEYQEHSTIIRYKSRKWVWTIDDEYWYNKYKFTIEDRELFKIVPASHYWVINGSKHYFTVSKNNPAYIYPIGNRRKIYMPYDNRGFKWTSNTTKDDVFGLHLLKYFDNIEYLFIESSYKDTGVMFKAGFPSLPTPSENSFLPEKLFNQIIKKGIKPILHFDNDEAGIRNAKVFSEKYNIPYITMPELYHEGRLLKDPSDFVEIYGYEELTIFINNKINNLNYENKN